MGKNGFRYFILSFFLSCLAFSIDIIIPLGYADWLLYLIPLIIVFLSQQKIFIVFQLIITALLFLLGLFLSPGELFRIALLQRIAAFITLAVFSVIVSKLISTQNILQQKTNDLISANRELETFSYSVSHDLRTPLLTIKGFSEILVEDYSKKIDNEGKDLLNRIRDDVKNMEELINDILTLSRISHSKIIKKAVDLSRIVQSISESLKNREPGRAVDVSIQESVLADADENMIKIALTNLIGNAWKFTSKQKNAYIEFGENIIKERSIYFIKDNGAGFAPKEAQIIFEPFTRVHAESEFPGTGIGLATVKRIIEKHGGKVWAESEVGKGAVFYFTLN